MEELGIWKLKSRQIEGLLFYLGINKRWHLIYNPIGRVVGNLSPHYIPFQTHNAETLPTLFLTLARKCCKQILVTCNMMRLDSLMHVFALLFFHQCNMFRTVEFHSSVPVKNVPETGIHYDDFS